MELEKGCKNNFTIPNLISFIRILLIIPLIYFFLNEEYITGVSILVVSGISDMLDGWIARKFNQISALGKILDPIADKLTLVAVIVCVGILIPSIIPLAVLLVTKDLLMLAGGYYLIKRKIVPPAAKWYGKLATLIFYISMVTIVFGKAFFNYENHLLSIVLLALTTISMLFALVKYYIIFLDLIRQQNKDKEKEERKHKT